MTTSPPSTRRRLTVTELVALVGAAAPWLAFFRESSQPVFLLTAIPPLLGIAWARRRGGRGIVGGAMGGAVLEPYELFYQWATGSLRLGDPLNGPAIWMFAAMMLAACGGLMGVVAWLIASALAWFGGRSRPS